MQKEISKIRKEIPFRQNNKQYISIALLLFLASVLYFSFFFYRYNLIVWFCRVPRLCSSFFYLQNGPFYCVSVSLVLCYVEVERINILKG